MWFSKYNVPNFVTRLEFYDKLLALVCNGQKNNLL